MIFSIFFAQNIECGYTLEQPRRGGSKECPHSMFWIKNKKYMYNLHTPVLLCKCGYKRVYITRTCYPDGI